MIRSGLFSHARSTNAAGTPSPPAVFQAIAKDFVEWQATSALQPPSLAEVQACVAKNAEAQATKKSQGAKRKARDPFRVSNSKNETKKARKAAKAQ